MIYVDGHMMAYWSRLPMHKGKIYHAGAYHGRLASVIAHDETGRAVFVASYAPDLHLSQIILLYCQKVAEATGSTVFVIDRRVNSVALAEAFDEQGLGLPACLMTTSMLVWRALKPPLWKPGRMAQGSIAGRGKSPAKMIPGTLVIVQPAAGRPWCIGALRR